LKQYGDVEEYVKFNTEKQNQQQLKNFNLFEYRRVILDLIVNLYQALIMQIQGLLDPKIVPAILNNDEIQRGRQAHGMRSRAPSIGASSSPEHGGGPAWKQLIGLVQEELKLAHAKLKAYRQDGGQLEHKLEEEMSRNKPNGTTTDVGANVTKQKSQNPQGLMKFHSSDLDKILQRLLSALTPRTVVGLLPGFPAYLIFMCIR